MTSAQHRISSRSILIAFAVFGCAAVTLAQTAPAADPAPRPRQAATTPASLDQRTLDKRTAPILKELALGDAERGAAVKTVLESHYQALQAWHHEHDAELQALWSRWAEARGANKDEVKAAGVAKEISDVYASFRPQHDGFLAKLSTLVTAEEVDVVKDAMTKSPGMKRTYDAYMQIVPTLKDDEMAFIREKMLAARETAMDAISNKEKADLFKVQKVQVEAFIDAKGYGWKKSYAAFAARLKAEAEAKKAHAKK